MREEIRAGRVEPGHDVGVWAYRCMNIHEYQAKAVLREFGVPVPRGHAAFSVEEAVTAAKHFATPVVKAQIHAGGRGKAGGVKVARSIEEVRREAQRLLGSVPDRSARQGGTLSLYRRRLGDRPGILPLRAGRSRNLPHRVRDFAGGRHGHRGSRAYAA
jgi:acyl-CoA synthetase (NDP forming)